MSRHPRENILAEDVHNILTAPLPWSDLVDTRVLVTGASGMISSYIVHALMELGERTNRSVHVTALVRNERRAADVFKMYFARDNFDLLVQDVIDEIPNRHPFDYTFHGASQASPKYFASNPVGTISANVLGTYSTIEASRATSRGYVFLSSGEVYGRHCSPVVSETSFGPLDPLEPRASYPESKRLGEALAVAWWREYGFPAKIARIFHTYGPGMALDDGRVFADFVSDVIHGRDITIKGNAEVRRAFCYISDTVRGLFTILLAGDAGEAYNIGNPSAAMSVGELAALLASLPNSTITTSIVRSALSSSPTSANPQLSTLPDVSKLQALGWIPIIRPRDGFSRTINALAAAHDIAI